MKDTILRQPVVTIRTGVPKSSLYRLISLNQFPKPIPIGARSVGWLESEVNTWIESKVNQRQVA